MKIRPDQIEGILSEQTQRKNQASESGQAFGEYLDQEVGKGQAPQAAAHLAPPPIVNPLLATGSITAVTDVSESGVTGQVESILDKWDTYTETLGASESGIKSAYGTLDEIANDVAAIKGSDTELDPGLKSIVDELETLTAVEQFKFNRGDYV